jgi:excinuclease ABC subunit A
MQNIIVKGAKEHNLKNIDVEIQRHKFVVVTGLSGSGKSSLAMDTIYAEGQRRYVESLSAYARQFLGLMEKPEANSIEGLSPAIAIDQKSTSKNPRSTVGTITEIYDYLRLLYAKVGTVYCPKCNVPISKQSITRIIDKITTEYNKKDILILSPIIKGKKGEHKDVLEQLKKSGYIRVRIDGEIKKLEDKIELGRYKIHHIEVVIDRLTIREGIRGRLSDSIETAVKLGKGLVIISDEKNKDKMYSEKFACIKCGFSYSEVSPRLFSFNGPYGACSACEGLGTRPDPSINYWQKRKMLRRYKRTHSNAVKEKIEEAMSLVNCDECNGTRLNKQALSVKIKEKNIAELCSMNIDKLTIFFEKLKLNSQENKIAKQILKEIKARIGFLKNVGLTYLSLNRTANTLSGGEAQRIRLATQIGSGLVDVLYVLDEPSIGLHQRDNGRLLKTLENLRDAGNTLIIIEHDEDTMKRADQIIDLGPGAGIHGGELVFSGTYEKIKKCKNSLTGKYLAGEKFIPIPDKYRKGTGKKLELTDVCHNNLKNINVIFPLGKMICITGVSGSGKSSLINDVLYKALKQELYGSKELPGAFDKIKGTENIDKVIIIDQSPIGRTPRSNPATYTDLFTHVRQIFAEIPLSKMRGYTQGRFSFNVKGGRCEACEGAGRIKVEMNFMPDVYVTCEECAGKRFNMETLSVKFKDKNIADILDMSIEEAFAFFQNIPKIKNKLETLLSVGLGYIKLGQSAVTLSGGEAQRIKLARELSKRSTGKTMYILDEPTTGLHFADVHKLLDVLNRLVDKGNTVLVIEHNLDVVKTSDHVIDLGPEGGDEGGEILCAGTPKQVSTKKKSYTGQYLKKFF